jgi:BlaI family transcriptional regulator, penicillinase repressor
MASTKLSKLELNIMEALWTRGACSIREIHDAFPKRGRPAYTTVQTMVYRLEAKQMVRRAKKISNAHIFEAVISRDAAHRRLVDDLLGLFGGQAQPVMAHLIESGKLTLDDIKAAEKTLKDSTRRDRSGWSRSCSPTCGNRHSCCSVRGCWRARAVATLLPFVTGSGSSLR